MSSHKTDSDRDKLKTPFTEPIYLFIFLLLAVLRSMVTATAFQILVSNNAPIKAIPDNTIVTLEVSVK